MLDSISFLWRQQLSCLLRSLLFVSKHRPRTLWYWLFHIFLLMLHSLPKLLHFSSLQILLTLFSSLLQLSICLNLLLQCSGFLAQMRPVNLLIKVRRTQPHAKLLVLLLTEDHPSFSFKLLIYCQKIYWNWKV